MPALDGLTYTDACKNAEVRKFLFESLAKTGQEAKLTGFEQVGMILVCLAWGECSSCLKTDQRDPTDARVVFRGQ